jgi:hypothetical protein
MGSRPANFQLSEGYPRGLSWDPYLYHVYKRSTRSLFERCFRSCDRQSYIWKGGIACPIVAPIVLAYQSHFVVFHSRRSTRLVYKEYSLLVFSKAFDKVPHKKLLCKLDNYGIRDTTLKWIGSFLNNRMQQAVLDGESSSKLPVN